ncbi:MAG: type 4a pilus biogenesis protein PilO [Candidatus Omnitrophota bacterium]
MIELGFDLKKLNLGDLKSKLKLDQSTTIVISIVLFSVVFLIWKQFIFRIEKMESDKLVQEMERIEFRNDVGNLNDVILSYEAKMPRVSDVSWLLNKVVEIADKAQIRLTFFEPLPSEALDRYAKVAVRVKTSITYHDLGRFVSMIESADRFIKIDGINMKNDMKTNIIETELIISALVHMEKQ